MKKYQQELGLLSMQTILAIVSKEIQEYYNLSNVKPSVVFLSWSMDQV